MNARGIYEKGLDKTPANFAQLTPLSFIRRTASVYPDLPAVVHGAKRQSWKETYARCRRLAGALAGRGIRPGDTVVLMGSNTPEMYEAAFGVPMTGAVLNALNTRLDAEAISFMLEHGGATPFARGNLRLCIAAGDSLPSTLEDAFETKTFEQVRGPRSKDG